MLHTKFIKAVIVHPTLQQDSRHKLTEDSTPKGPGDSCGDRASTLFYKNETISKIYDCNHILLLFSITTYLSNLKLQPHMQMLERCLLFFETENSHGYC